MTDEALEAMVRSVEAERADLREKRSAMRRSILEAKPALREKRQATWRWAMVTAFLTAPLQVAIAIFGGMGWFWRAWVAFTLLEAAWMLHREAYFARVAHAVEQAEAWAWDEAPPA